MKYTYVFAALALVIASCQFDPADARSKKWTISDRQDALGWQVDAGFRSKELTLKECDRFHSRLQKLNERIEDMKFKNGGKLSYADQGKCEKVLNNISIDLKKAQLLKRVQPK